MSTLFYLISFLIVLVNIPILYNWKEIHNRFSRMMTTSEDGKIIIPERDLRVSISVISSTLTLLWSLIGLLSSNWFIFSSILILVMSNYFIEKIYRSYIISGLILTIVTLLLLLASLNYFHNFNIDFYGEFKKIMGI